MSKRLKTYPCIFLSACILLGCGNKGELFLPEDQQLAREFEAATDATSHVSSDPLDQADDKKKRPADEPLQ